MPETIDGQLVVGFNPIVLRGTDGVSVVSARIDGSGHLILTLSSGPDIDVGVVAGAGSGNVTTVTAGDSTVTVDNADPANPTVKVTAGTFDAAGVAASAQSAAATYADGKVVDSIADADTTHAPSRNAVFDALTLKADLASPALTGSPTAPTQAAGDNSTKLATTGYVATASGLSVPTNYLAPSGALYETFRRQYASTGNLQPTIGTLHLFGIEIPAGTVIGHLNFFSNQSVFSQTHLWYALFDSSRALLALTADQLAGGTWNGNTFHPLAIATVAGGAASSFTTTYTGLHYIGLAIAGGSAQVPALTVAPSGSTGASVMAQAPLIAGTSNTGMTTPPAFPFTANALSGVGLGYGYVAA